MKKILLSAAVAGGLLVSGSFGQDISLSSGWQLKGTETGLTTNDLNKSCINTVWKYNGDWEAYSPNSNTKDLISSSGITELSSLNKNDGFWVNVGNDCNVSSSTTTNTIEDIAFQFENITSYNIDASSVFIEDNKLKFSNMKIVSNSTDINDSIDLSYKINIEDMTLIPENNKTKIYKNIGIFNNDDLALFVNDITHDINMTYSDTPESDGMTMGTSKSLIFTQSDNETFLNLEVGQVISFLTQSPSDDYKYTLYSPSGEDIYNYEGLQGNGVISFGIAIKENGQYKFVMEPKNDDSMTVSLMFLNANRRDLKLLENGDSIYVNFMSNIRDYDKYELNLVGGEELIISDPSDSNIHLKLLNENGKSVSSTTGLPLVYTVEENGKYYLFIYDKKGWGGSYSGSVNIDSSNVSNAKTLARSISTTKKSQSTSFSQATAAKE